MACDPDGAPAFLRPPSQGRADTYMKKITVEFDEKTPLHRTILKSSLFIVRVSLFLFHICNISGVRDSPPIAGI